MLHSAPWGEPIFHMKYVQNETSQSKQMLVPLVSMFLPRKQFIDLLALLTAPKNRNQSWVLMIYLNAFHESECEVIHAGKLSPT